MENERKVVLYIAQSLDGYIARGNGDIDWLEGDGSEPDSDFGYNDFYESIDTIIIGRNTYEQIIQDLSPEQWPYEGKETYVVTTDDLEPNKNVEFIKEDVVNFIKQLKEKEGKDIWIVGGAILIDALIKENIVDEYIISIMPTILGFGIKLFNENNPEIKLKFNGSSVYNGAVVLHYLKDKVIVG